jgi:type IV secretion system protein VirB9
MLKSFIYSLAITGLTLMPALAEQNPVGQHSDVRIKKYVYDENNVYNLNLYLKTVTAIQLAPDELVQSILIGDSASWEVVKLKSGNVVSIKPIIDQALTNMTVYTDQRVYTFQLRSVGSITAGAKHGAGQSFRTSFTYPAKDVDKYKVVSGPINSDYLVSGKSNFRPISVSDNEHQTTFDLMPGAQRPAVFKVGSDGKERLINSRTEGNRMIVDGISDFWVMRIGDDVVCVGKARAIQPSKKNRKG